VNTGQPPSLITFENQTDRSSNLVATRKNSGGKPGRSRETDLIELTTYGHPRTPWISPGSIRNQQVAGSIPAGGSSPFRRPTEQIEIARLVATALGDKLLHRRQLRTLLPSEPQQPYLDSPPVAAPVNLLHRAWCPRALRRCARPRCSRDFTAPLDSPNRDPISLADPPS
jgi:hypothetical protein